jgi:hypothetical protein
MGFAAIVGKEKELPLHFEIGKPIEITNSSLYGYEGGLFENGKAIASEPKLNLPCLSSLTSDKFIRPLLADNILCKWAKKRKRLVEIIKPS